MKLIYLIFIFFLVNITIKAQGFLYKEGESGYGCNINYNSNNEGNGYSSNFSYTINSMISLGAAVGIGKNKNPETSSTAFGPYLNFYPVKYTKADPLTIVFGAGLNYYVHSNEILDSLNLDMIGASIIANCSVLYHIRIDQSWQIVPGVSFGYQYKSLRISDKNYASMEIKGNYTSIELSVDVAFRIYEKSLLYFGPAITFGVGGEENDRAFYGGGVGVAFK